MDTRIFIKRTLCALKQYKEHLPKGETSYIRTLFINSSLALLIAPKEELYEIFPCESVATWDFSEDLFHYCEPTIQEVVKHMRNAISHYHFEYETGDMDQSIPLDHIKVTDYNNNNNQIVFQTTLDYDTYKKFILKVADFALQKLEE